MKQSKENHMPIEKPDCTKCGICCISLRPDQGFFCDLTNKELIKLSRQFISRNVVLFQLFDQITRKFPPAALRTKRVVPRTGPLKDHELNVCCMLRGTALKKVSCKIYETRPSACKSAVKPGDRTCLTARRKIQKELEE